MGASSKTSRPGAGAATPKAAAPEPLDLSDLSAQEIEALVERTNRELGVRPRREKEAHFVQLIDGHRKQRDQPLGGGVVDTDYTAKFYDQVTSPPRWEDFVSEPAHATAKQLLNAGIETGYVDHVTISGPEYLKHLTGTGNRIITHGYADQPAHHAELLSTLKGAGLDVPYEVHHVATLAHAPANAMPDAHVKVEGGHGRSMLTALVFEPRSPEEATKLVDTLVKQGGATAKKAPGAWQRPDIRTAFDHEEFEPQILNEMPAGDQHVSVLKPEAIEGFRTHVVHRNPRVQGTVKSLPVYVVDHRAVRFVIKSSPATPELPAPYRLTPVTRTPIEVRPRLAPPPPSFAVPGELVGRPGLHLKALPLLARIDTLPLASQQVLQAHLTVLGACLKAIAGVHQVPPLDGLTLVVGPAEQTQGTTLALAPSDVRGMARHLRLSPFPCLKACPSAGRYGLDLAAVAYDHLVAQRTGWARDTLTPDEAVILHPLLLDMLDGRPSVALVVGH